MYISTVDEKEVSAESNFHMVYWARCYLQLVWRCSVDGRADLNKKTPDDRWIRKCFAFVLETFILQGGREYGKTD